MSNYFYPDEEQFASLVALGDDGPIHMLNLIKLRAKAAYDDGREMSGLDAYKQYGKQSEKFFHDVGGTIVHSWNPQAVVIGPQGEEDWDLAFIAEYPTASAFVKMVRNSGYQAIVHHRQAAVENSRLVCLRPSDPGKGFG